MGLAVFIDGARVAGAAGSYDVHNPARPAEVVGRLAGVIDQMQKRAADGAGAGAGHPARPLARIADLEQGRGVAGLDLARVMELMAAVGGAALAKRGGVDELDPAIAEVQPRLGEAGSALPWRALPLKRGAMA